MTALEVESCELSECPYCGSTHLDGDSPDPDIGGRKVRCEDCERYWDEGFVFTTVFIPDEYKAIYLERKFIQKHCICNTKLAEVEFCPVHSEELNK